jgi:nucleoside-diphosphate-sugar epimerase
VKRVLLLGGTGFIGSWILGALRRVRHVRIMMLAHRRVPYRELEDVNLVVDSLTRFDLGWLDAFQPDTVIHAARLAGAGRLRRSIASRKGERANQRLVDALTERAPATRVIYVSGTLVYGDRGEADTDERAPLKPTAFAREYIRAEQPWMEAQRTEALPVTIVRPPWVVGPGSWLQAHFVGPALRDGGVPLYGSGANWMSLLDVEDCAGAIVHLAGHPSPPKSVNLCAPGQTLRQSTFVEGLAGLLGLEVRPAEVAGRRRRADRALVEALTSSLRAATTHQGTFDDYAFSVPRWQDMLARHARLA